MVGGIVLAGATIIAVVQNDKKKESNPEIHQAGDGHNHPAVLPATPSASPTINPAHGLPGHRCDLPVGAPLSTSPGAGPVQSPPAIKMNPTPVQSGPPATTPAPSVSGLKINPAHGMPGHRCDIQVGAPLS